jgi:hypothetical protein
LKLDVKLLLLADLDGVLLEHPTLDDDDDDDDGTVSDETGVGAGVICVWVASYPEVVVV